MPPRNAVRDAEALVYRARGWTYQRIANEMGYGDKSAARKACERALAADVRETREEAKSLLLMDLNAAKQAAWAVLDASHITISNGQAVKLDGTPVPDDAPVLAAIDRIVRIDQEIAKILGAYAPVRHEVRQIEEIDARLLNLADEVALGNPGAAPGVPREA
jgi:hypothetical protein